MRLSVLIKMRYLRFGGHAYLKYSIKDDTC